MSLEKYTEKRSFDRTPEPRAASGPISSSNTGLRFFVQRHSARRLHYDLRLEWEGVLKSWAVPKGPTLDPGEKRLAVLVEDHPMDYGIFEGTIPAGNYGAGSVLLWDRGTYEWLPGKTPESMWQAGDLKFRLHGEKLMGEFALVCTKRGKGNEWLLIKKKDFAARPGWDAESDLRSVVAAAVEPERIAGAVAAAMPAKVTPMAAFLAGDMPQGAEWVYEIKWDGFRAICYIEKGKLRLRSRNDNPLDALFPELRPLPTCLQAESAILDGEIVCLNEKGQPSFELIQQRTGLNPGGATREKQKTPAVLFAFDLLYLNGYDLRPASLEDRKHLLHSIIKPNPLIRYSEHFTGDGEKLLAAARQNGLEGIMAKRAGSSYEPRRSPNWLKVKIVNQQEFVICGWTEGQRAGVGSVILGYYAPTGAPPAAGRRRSRSAAGMELVWAGNAGTGFSVEGVKALMSRLRPLATGKAPFKSVPAELRDAHWVRPELVCEIKFSNWTRDGRLRAPVFLGLRTDVEPADCVREAQVPVGVKADSNPVTRSSTARKPRAGASSRQSRTASATSLLPNSQSEVTLRIDGRDLKFTNLDKVFYPRENYTKRDVINYYNSVASLIVPHLADRPLSLKRYPNGIEGKFFFQKNAPDSFPEWLRIEPIDSEERGAKIRYVVCDDRATLLYLANLACIDQNPWMSRVGSLDHPDFILIDLDPVECAYDRIVEAAQLVKRKLDAIGLEGFPKTTGGDGMHVYVPLAPRYTYEQTRTFAEVLARLCADERPDLFTTPRPVEKRAKGKVYFDYLQNREGSTIAAPYVLRAYPGAPVSAPLKWEEVVKGLTPAQFTLRNAPARFERLGDMFAQVLRSKQRLEKPLERLSGLLNHKA